MIISSYFSKKHSFYYLALVFLLSFSFFIISFSEEASAIGIAPGERAFVYAGQPIEYEIRIFNDEHKTSTYSVELNGELSKYATLSKKTIYFSDTQSDEVISLKFFIPEGENVPPGDYTVRIIVNTKTEGSAGVVAFVGVISKLNINIPGNDAYVKAQLFVPNFIRENENSFSVEIINKGIKPAENCIAVIDVLTSMNSKVVSLISNKVTVQGTRTERVYMPWTPTVNNGNYLARASVICDGTSSDDEKTFSIGSPEVTVISLKSDSFTLGEINKFDLLLQSEWGENIPEVYADIDLAKEGASVFKTKTITTDMMPLEKAIVPVYLDTKGLAPGKYSLYIMLHYLDKDVGEAYDVQMGSDEILIGKATGLVAGGGKGDAPKSSDGGTNGLLIMAIIIIIVVNVILVLKLAKKKK